MIVINKKCGAWVMSFFDLQKKSENCCADTG